MRETDWTQKIRLKLMDRGFLVFKHNDRIAKGIPDTSATGYGNTYWLEMKVLRRVNPCYEINWNTIIKPKDRLQLVNMVRLADRGLALYVLIQSTPRHSISPVWYSLALPKDVQQSVLQNKSMEFSRATNLDWFGSRMGDYAIRPSEWKP